ncbi:MAG: type I-C CRISPR-associated protein Cas8c/Csd1 [Calditrichaeota bacterium]|nr:type I-C CRISPR-associated protein Cas8c/Csd1 [Calditrichota bacterium]
MILKKLKEFAGRVELAQSGYAPMSIAWVLDLDAKGNLLSVIPTTNKENPRGIVRMTPNPNLTGKRANAIKPGLFADTAEYVLSKVSDARKDKEDRIAEMHCAFKEAVVTCAASVDHSSVRGVAKFYERDDNLTHPDLKPIEGGHNVTFKVNGVFPIELAAVREYWIASQGAAMLERSDKRGICSVCGQADRSLLLNIPVPLKRVPGGQPSGVALVSFNDDAFESFGLQRAQNAPICLDCAETTHNAINHLISTAQHNFRLGSKAVFLYWTRDDDPFDLNRLFDQPTEADVGVLFESAYRGRGGHSVTMHADQFYCFALTGSGGRAVVKNWIEASLPSVKTSLARYFKAQEITGGREQPWHKLIALAGGTVRDLDQLAPWVTLALVDHALKGDPLPPALLTTAIRRCAVGKKFNDSRTHVSHAQAALIKLCLISLKQQNHKHITEDWMVKLDPQLDEPAYLYGRLFHELERIQEEAASGVNSVERTFGTAVSTPVSALPRLIARARQAHLPKLHRDKKGMAVNFEKRLGEILGLLSPQHAFKSRLTAEEQGLFVLGYWHQKASHFQKKSADETTDTSNQTEE